MQCRVVLGVWFGDGKEVGSKQTCRQCCLWGTGCREAGCRGLPWGYNLVLQHPNCSPFLLPLFCLFLMPAVSWNCSITWGPHGSGVSFSGEGHGAGGRARIRGAGAEEPPNGAGSFLASCEAGIVDSGSPGTRQSCLWCERENCSSPPGCVNPLRCHRISSWCVEYGRMQSKETIAKRRGEIQKNHEDFGRHWLNAPSGARI